MNHSTTSPQPNREPVPHRSGPVIRTRTILERVLVLNYDPVMDDRYALERLKYRYLRTLDLKQWDEFAACFVPEATADYAGLAFGSRDELVGYMRANLGPGLITMHTAHHPEIEVSGDEATAIWYLEDTVLAPELSFALEGAAFYEDHCVRTPDGWRIVHTGYRRTYEKSWSTSDVASLKITTGTAYEAPPRL